MSNSVDTAISNDTTVSADVVSLAGVMNTIEPIGYNTDLMAFLDLRARW